MAEREDHHSDDSVNRFRAVVREAESSSHHAEAEPADSARHHVAMLEDSADQRDRAEEHRQRQPHFVNDRLSEEAAGRSEQPKQDRGRQAMDQAQAGQAHGDPVEPRRRNRELKHCAGSYSPPSGKLQHYIERFCLLPLASAQAKRRSPMASSVLPTTAHPDAQSRPAALARLLFLVAALVFAMVVVGGITRLTESGLSITEWKPVSGAIPPLTHADWQRAFNLYRQTPQYREVAGPAGMTLAGFKFIFFWEWVHRFLGRLIGLVFFLGVAWFALKRAIPKGFGWRLAALFLLGGAQGAVGWFMVMSGLEGRTEVS